MIKKILELDSKLKSNLNFFDKVILYLKIRILCNKIKKSIFRDHIITKRDLIFFIQILNYASIYLKEFNINEFSSWYKLIDDVLGIKIFVNCDPIHVTLYCGNDINYKYELNIKEEFNSNNRISSTREIDVGIDRNSDYIYDTFIYLYMKIYIAATINTIEDIWIDMLRSPNELGGLK